MNWLAAIDPDEILTLCPELKMITTRSFLSADDAIALVREEKATHIFRTKIPKAMYPTLDPHEFNHLIESRTREHKDYNQEQVKQFDLIKNTYWERVKNEINLLICTKDKKYAALRKHLAETREHAKAPIVGIISATLASSMGVAVGVISGLVAVILFAALQIGINAYCARAT